jgi:hypothetical protein
VVDRCLVVRTGLAHEVPAGRALEEGMYPRELRA